MIIKVGHNGHEEQGLGLHSDGKDVGKREDEFSAYEMDKGFCPNVLQHFKVK